MDPLTLPQLVKEYGGWGAASGAIIFAGWCLRGWLACFEARVAEGGKVAAALERTSQTSAALGAAMESRQGINERLVDRVDEALRTMALNHQIIITKLDSANRGDRS